MAELLRHLISVFVGIELDELKGFASLVTVNAFEKVANRLPELGETAVLASSAATL